VKFSSNNKWFEKKQKINILDVYDIIICMNRIRRVGKIYQVLTTPHQKYDVGFEYLLGSWTDEALMGFEVKDFNTYFDAECEASKFPDINWDQLVDYHKDPYIFLKKYIQTILDHVDIMVQFKSQILNPEQTKNKMFDRVHKGQISLSENDDCSNFRTVYDMNDIISFTIVNPWTKNLNEIELHLMKNARLNIFNRIEKNNIVHLVGRTDIGTTYEILLLPSILNNWMEWRQKHLDFAPSQHSNALKNCVKTQRIIDSTPVLR
jgi:hypothetical protein